MLLLVDSTVRSKFYIAFAVLDYKMFGILCYILRNFLEIMS
jgi:hypothetical protein